MTFHNPAHHAEQLAKARAAFKQNPTPALSTSIRRLERALKWKPPELSKGYSQRGAQMGRRDNIEDPDAPVKFHLVKMRMVGAYDQGGAYWGIGDPLWRAIGEDEDMTNEMFIRAKTRDAAKASVLETFPKARFYR
jgi:hypothetical protein